MQFTAELYIDDIQRIELETFTKGEGDNANKCFKFVLCFQKIKI